MSRPLSGGRRRTITDLFRRPSRWSTALILFRALAFRFLLLRVFDALVLQLLRDDEMVFIFERFSSFGFCFHGFIYFYGVFTSATTTTMSDLHATSRSPTYW